MYKYKHIAQCMTSLYYDYLNINVNINSWAVLVLWFTGCQHWDTGFCVLSISKVIQEVSRVNNSLVELPTIRTRVKCQGLSQGAKPRLNKGDDTAETWFSRRRRTNDKEYCIHRANVCGDKKCQLYRYWCWFLFLNGKISENDNCGYRQCGVLKPL